MLAELLGTRQPPAVQTAAIETLARFDDIRAASILLRRMARDEPQAARDGGRGSLCQAGLGRSVPRRGREGHRRPCRCRPRPARAAQEVPGRRGASAGRQHLRRGAAPPAGRGRRLSEIAAVEGGPRARQGRLQRALLVVPPTRRSRPAGRRRSRRDPRPRPRRRCCSTYSTPIAR